MKAGLGGGRFSEGFTAHRFRSIEVKGEFPAGGVSVLASLGETLGWRLVA